MASRAGAGSAGVSRRPCSGETPFQEGGWSRGRARVKRPSRRRDGVGGRARVKRPSRRGGGVLHRSRQRVLSVVHKSAASWMVKVQLDRHYIELFMGCDERSFLANVQLSAVTLTQLKFLHLPVLVVPQNWLLEPNYINMNNFDAQLSARYVQRCKQG